MNECKSFVQAMRVLQEKVRLLQAERDELQAKLDLMTEYWEQRVAEILHRGQEEHKGMVALKDQMKDSERRRAAAELALSQYVEEAEAFRAKACNDISHLKDQLGEEASFRDAVEQQLRDEVEIRMRVNAEREIGQSDINELKREIGHLVRSARDSEERSNKLQKALEQEDKIRSELMAKFETTKAELGQTRQSYNKYRKYD